MLYSAACCICLTNAESSNSDTVKVQPFQSPISYFAYCLTLERRWKKVDLDIHEYICAYTKGISENTYFHKIKYMQMQVYLV